MSLPEILLWQQLRKRPGGYKFRRQVPIAPYVADFACLSARLIVEVDGGGHDAAQAQAYDIGRDASLSSKGFAVLRLRAQDILNDIEGAVRMIEMQCGRLGPLHRPVDGPPPRSGEEL